MYAKLFERLKKKKVFDSMGRGVLWLSAVGEVVKLVLLL